MMVKMDQPSSLPEWCPLCHEKNRNSKLLFIYFNRAEAFRTCESKECVYFITDKQGNPVKFQYDEKLSRLVPITTPAKVEDADADLEELIQSLQAENAPQNTETNASSNTAGSNYFMPKDEQHVDLSHNYCSFDFDSFMNNLTLS